MVRYGTTRDLVLGLEVVLPDGSLLSHLAPLHKNTTGYDIRQLFIGSEGTLGIITAATLKLFSPPQTTATAWVGLNSIEDAVHLLTRIQGRFAERLCSFELVSHPALALSAAYSRLSPPIDAEWHILLELNDSLPRPELADDLAGFLFEHGWENAVLAQSEGERAELWRLREDISAAQKALGASIKHDIAVPIARVAELVANASAALKQAYEGIEIIVFGHLGDGSLHFNTFLPHIRSNQAYEYEDGINRIVYQHTLACQGTIAAEHGIGQVKNHWLPSVRSPVEIELMRAIKKQLDPHNLFNPGKLFPPQATCKPLTSNTRKPNHEPSLQNPLPVAALHRLGNPARPRRRLAVYVRRLRPSVGNQSRARCRDCRHHRALPLPRRRVPPNRRRLRRRARSRRTGGLRKTGQSRALGLKRHVSHCRSNTEKAT